MRRVTADEGVYLSIPYRTDSGESDQKDEFEGAITKSCSTDPQFPNQAAKNETQKSQFLLKSPFFCVSSAFRPLFPNFGRNTTSELQIPLD